MNENLIHRLQAADSKTRRRQTMLLLCLVLLLLITAIISWGTGYSQVGLSRVPALINQTASNKEVFILLAIRLPRILIMVLAGASLAVAGALIQNLTRNPLADPGLLGINAGAGLGVAVVYLLLPVSAAVFSWAIPLAASLGGLACAMLIYWSSFKNGQTAGLKLVLTGVCLSTALSGLMVLLVSSAEREKVDFIVKWLSGSVWGAEYAYVWVMLVGFVSLTALSMTQSKALDLFTLGDMTASNLGVNGKALSRRVILICALMSALAVAFAGGVSFIGLMAPHIARKFSGPKTRPLLMISGSIGAILLLTADTLGRVLAMPAGIPAGILTAILGAPYLIWLMLKTKQ